MQQQGLLTICAETRAIEKPVLDYNGKPYKWEFDTAETGKYAVDIHDKSAIDVDVLIDAIRPCNKVTAQQTLEFLAQIKPIGKSEAKQQTVIGFLVFDLAALGVSDLVINEVATEFRRATDSPFFPEHGNFLERCKRKMRKYQAVYDELNKPVDNIDNVD